MIVFPAIDLKDGKCVRLFKGDFSQVTVFNDDPIKQAQKFIEEDFRFLHLVNLDGAIANNDNNQKMAQKNYQIVKEIISNFDISVQLGGGIRTIKDIETWLNIGVSRVIIGTMVVENTALAIEACKEFNDSIVLGIDAIEDKMAISGWQKISDISPQQIVTSFSNLPSFWQPSAIIYTDISRDGTMQGLNIEATIQLAKNSAIPVIASGGLSNIDELEILKNHQKQGTNIEGAILGKAYYQNKITAKDLANHKFI